MITNFLFAKLKFSTARDPAFVVDKLKQVVLTREHPVFRLAHRLPQHEFSGSFNGYSFRIRRINPLVKYSLPLIIGEYGQNETHTEIKITIRLHWIHYTFLSLILIVGILSFLPFPEISGNNDRESQIMSCCLIIALWGFACFLVQNEVSKTRKKFIRIFESQEI